MKKPPPLARAAAATGFHHLQHRDDSATRPSLQLSPDVRQLVERIGQDRAIRLERAAALRAGYAALARANELAPAADLRGAAVVVLGQLAQTRADLARLREFVRFSGIGEP